MYMVCSLNNAQWAETTPGDWSGCSSIQVFNYITGTLTAKCLFILVWTLNVKKKKEKKKAASTLKKIVFSDLLPQWNILLLQNSATYPFYKLHVTFCPLYNHIPFTSNLSDHSAFSSLS